MVLLSIKFSGGSAEAVLTETVIVLDNREFDQTRDKLGRNLGVWRKTKSLNHW
jgi:hypothetical protein